KKNAESAVKFATETKDVELAKELLAYVKEDRSTPVKAPVPDSIEEGRPRLVRREETVEQQRMEPVIAARGRTFRVEGTLQQLDCLGEAARLRIAVAEKQVALLIQDPSAVVIKSSIAEAGHYDFQCGPQKPVNISVEYVIVGTEGLVRSIEFR